MNTTELLSKDFRTEDGKRVIRKALLKIKPLSKYENKEIPLEILEKYVEKVCRKYDVKIQYLQCTFMDEESRWYSLSLMEKSTSQWLDNIYAHTLYEMWAKLSIQLFVFIKTSRIKQKEEEE